MQVLISDANVLIDMEDGQLLERMFQLPFQFKVSDMLFQDELSELHPHLLEFGLVPTELTGESMVEALRMTRLYAGPSRYDCCAGARQTGSLSVANRRCRFAQSGSKRSGACDGHHLDCGADGDSWRNRQTRSLGCL